jgi:hypothetical protein
MLLDSAHATILESYEKDLGQRAAAIRALAPIASIAEAAQRNDLNAAAKKAIKQLEETRKNATAQLVRDKATIDDAFNGLKARLAECSNILDRQLLAWEDQEAARVRREREESERKQREAAEAEAKAIQSGDMKAAEQASQAQTAALLAAPVQEAPKGIKSEGGTSFRRDVWVFSVIDAEQVPRNYCSPDASKIRVAINNGVREIPGLVIESEAKRTTRTR